MNASPETPGLRWVLRYSAIAYFVIVLLQSFAVVNTIPKFPQLFAGFGAEPPAVTTFVIRYHWLGCAVVAIVSLMSTCLLVFKPTAPATHLKFLYFLSLVALIGAFACAGFALTALYAPIISLGHSI